MKSFNGWWLHGGLILIALLAVARPATTTTIIEKRLDQLCAEADRVFVGTVAEIQSQWADAAHQYIETSVRFSAIEPLFGVEATEVALRFAGGTVGEITEHVPGVPTFTVGQRAVLFVRDGPSASPIVGFNQGCFLVAGQGDEATVPERFYEHVGTLADGRAVIDEAAVETGRRSLRDFLIDVRQRLARRHEGQ